MRSKLLKKRIKRIGNIRKSKTVGAWKTAGNWSCPRSGQDPIACVLTRGHAKGATEATGCISARRSSEGSVLAAGRWGEGRALPAHPAEGGAEGL